MTEQTNPIRRGDTYKLLAACFYEPEKQLLIEENLCGNLRDLLQDQAAQAVGPAMQMAEALEYLDQKQMSIDHAALFIGPFELLAAPYGSVWLERSRRVMGDSTMRVMRYYQDAGLDTDVTEPPDHIAIELEFMYYLCQQEAAASAKYGSDETGTYLQLQQEFLNGALFPWVFSFCDEIQKTTSNNFYQALASTLAAFMQAEQERCQTIR